MSARSAQRLQCRGVRCLSLEQFLRLFDAINQRSNAPMRLHGLDERKLLFEAIFVRSMSRSLHFERRINRDSLTYHLWCDRFRDIPYKVAHTRNADSYAPPVCQLEDAALEAEQAHVASGQQADLLL